jgi:hypothetical protein
MPLHIHETVDPQRGDRPGDPTGKLRSPLRRAMVALPHRPHPVMSAALVPPELLDPVLAYFRPRRVILFGSAARGEAGPDSDIDLLVVVDNDTPAEKVTIKAGRESRRPYRLPADVIPVREATWRRFNRVVGTLPYAARTEGIVVYERG